MGVLSTSGLAVLFFGVGETCRNGVGDRRGGVGVCGIGVRFQGVGLSVDGGGAGVCGIGVRFQGSASDRTEAEWAFGESACVSAVLVSGAAEWACVSAELASRWVAGNEDGREMDTTSNGADAADTEAARRDRRAICNNRNPVPTTSRRRFESKPIRPAGRARNS